MTDIKVGDTVEVSFRGTVETVGSATFCIKREHGGTSYIRKEETTFVSRPKPPMPTAIGTVLRENDKHTWMKTPVGWVASWFYSSTTETWSDEALEFYWNNGSLKEVSL